ncbi:ribbon-helix-helix domain-containing protein [Saccharolobus shibatae]|uniref:Ribbon-helix-helix protein CopG domain-containing protein n=1 Tax=Saccharolobus shibatae TaxID=2286 RepID=A0A8F5GZ87_9CREN|nr:ribbon-helix-helix domain-containing protein [Saccharolobus shibatae]QXJ31825.1 hypothetical protein J5U21_01476 [Saccharolobus shibatae]QXJ34846.1 hypothetical protein J5U22_01393 [Saccharolobus shibatae]
MARIVMENIDENLYKMLKVKAEALGISVSEAIQQAIALWPEVANSVKDLNYVVLKTDPNAIKAYNEGKYVLVCEGKFIGAGGDLVHFTLPGGYYKSRGP